MRSLDYAKTICYSSEKTLEFTAKATYDLLNIEGDLVECGVAAGAQIIAMLAMDDKKTIHAFDSFQGIPHGSNRDDQIPGKKFLTDKERMEMGEPGKQVLESTGVSAVSEIDFIKNIYKAFWPIDKTKQIEIHSGWFEITVPDCGIKKISLLRLDGDLYNSTKVCLEYLYPKVVPGGMIIIDDWALRGSREAVIDYFGGIPGHRLIDETDRDSPCYFWK